MEARIALALLGLAMALNHAITAHGLPAHGKSFANLAPMHHANPAGAPADIRNATSAEADMAIASGAVMRNEQWKGTGYEVG